MPAGFANIRYDPTTDPRYGQPPRSTTKEQKQEKKQKTIVLSDKDVTKSKSSDEKSLASTASRRGLLSVFRS